MDTLPVRQYTILADIKNGQQLQTFGVSEDRRTLTLEWMAHPSRITFHSEFSLRGDELTILMAAFTSDKHAICFVVEYEPVCAPQVSFTLDQLTITRRSDGGKLEYCHSK